MKRRQFLALLSKGIMTSFIPGFIQAKKPDYGKPNIILCMCDDLGWGDVGFHGNNIVKTPNLDEMAAGGLRFDRFYSAAPVCSPTRGSCLTGRHPYRYGIFSANVGHIKSEELTLAEILRLHGYTTGHFGKWHLGTLTKTIKDSNRGGPRGVAHYSPPWENGFDVCFSTEAKVPTWDPMIKPSGWKDQRWWNAVSEDTPIKPYGTHYWVGPGQYETENLEGDDSRIIMDRAIPFIQDAVKQKKPFFAVIWFHAPHWPVVTGPQYRKIYSNLDEFAQNYFGCITAMDEQVGRLRNELRRLGIAENTMLWFCSDNGPEGTPEPGRRHGIGSAGPFRGRKRSLYEGGIRVPGILEWPNVIRRGWITNFPACTSDYYPTILDILNIHPEDQPEPIDGISLFPLITGKIKNRQKRIGFQSGKQIALIDNQFKLISTDNGSTFELYDLYNDPCERHNVANQYPQIVEDMKKELLNWKASCKASLKGDDYRKKE